MVLMLLFVTSAQQVFANEIEQHTTTETIDYIYYDTLAKTYYMNTYPDASGGFWTLDLLCSNREDKNMLEALNKYF
ncbi:hypothetical protein [Paenibacillus filicis]|uniref:hypothetical protein n=1 Tax=Paenibacillus filicis TaxID=669464 RepID=UPI0031192383